MTVDTPRQGSTGGKVSNGELENAVRTLRARGVTKENIGVYLMFGLPDQSLDEVRDGVEFLKNLKVRIYLAEFSPVKGTECWKELVQNGVIMNELDPLLTNNTVFSYLYSGYDQTDVKRMKLDVLKYNQAD